MANTAVPIELTPRQLEILEKWVSNKAKVPYRLVERSSIFLLAHQGLTIQEQATRLQVDRQRIRRWRARWAANRELLLAAESENADPKDLPKLMAELLEDAPRSGAPPRFSAEELTQIFALACEPPGESGRPVTQRTPRELANEAIKRGIVSSISARHLDRVLKGGSPSAQVKVLAELEG
jgi:putative transposase